MQWVFALLPMSKDVDWEIVEENGKMENQKHCKQMKKETENWETCQLKLSLICLYTEEFWVKSCNTRT